jgi:hypothetical protein
MLLYMWYNLRSTAVYVFKVEPHTAIVYIRVRILCIYVSACCYCVYSPHTAIVDIRARILLYMSPLLYTRILLLCIYVSACCYICCMCPHTAIYAIYVCSYNTHTRILLYVSVCCYICCVCVLILLYMLYMCPHITHIHAFCYMCRPAAIYVSSYYCIQVEADDLLLTVVAIYVSAYCYVYVCPHTAAIYVSSILLYEGGGGRPLANCRCYMCPHTTVYLCVLILLLYMCLYTTVYRWRRTTSC